MCSMSPAMTPWRDVLKKLVRSMQSSTTQAYSAEGRWKAIHLIVSDRYSIIQAVLPAWRKRGSGVIVNVSSVGGRVSSPLEAAYSASKFALEALTESLHLEVRHFGIRSVLIEPGTIDTGMKAIEPHKGPAEYAGLWEQWAGAHTKMTGPSLPGPEVVGLAIARAIEDPATPLRVPVGQDAEMILGMRRSLDDQALEAAMRKALGITW